MLVFNVDSVPDPRLRAMADAATEDDHEPPDEPPVPESEQPLAKGIKKFFTVTFTKLKAAGHQLAANLNPQNFFETRQEPVVSRPIIPAWYEDEQDFQSQLSTTGQFAAFAETNRESGKLKFAVTYSNCGCQEPVQDLVSTCIKLYRCDGAVCDADLPNRPEMVEMVRKSPGSITLQWRDGGESLYVVTYRSLDTEDTVEVAENEVTLSALNPSTVYTVTVQAKCEFGLSEKSNELQCQTD